MAAIPDLDALVRQQDESIIQSMEWYAQLKNAIDYLIANDFGRLVQLLYQVDVPEQKLKKLLSENKGADASVIIADLLLQRQREKVAARKMFSSKSRQDDEEKW